MLLLGALGLGRWLVWNYRPAGGVPKSSEVLPPTVEEPISPPSNSIIYDTVAVSVIDASNWRTYRNDNYGFEFEYPPEWQMSEAKNSSYYRLVLGNPLSGLRWYSFEIYIMQNPKRLSAKDYAKNVLATREEENQETGIGISPEKEFSVKVRNYDGYEFFGVFGGDQHTEAIYVTSGDRAFLFQFPVARENDNLSKPIENNAVVHKILSTLRFIK